LPVPDIVPAIVATKIVPTTGSGGSSNLTIDTYTRLRWFKRREDANGWGEDLQLINLWDDVTLSTDESMSKFNKGYYVDHVNLKGVTYDTFYPSTSYHADFVTDSNTKGNYYVFLPADMRYNGAPIWTSGGKGEGGYTYNSSPELENYAWQTLMKKGITPNHKTMKVPHNIRIQGGLMISDEYSAPVLP